MITPGHQAPATSIHPRLTVVRAGAAERGRLVESLGLPTVGAADLDTAAVGVAADRSAERQARRAELDAVVARLGHDAGTARSQLEHLTQRRQMLLDGADWAEAALARLPELETEVQAARAELEARQAAQRTARTGLEKVLEQRAAANAAMEQAEHELAELVGVGLDETALRRELEAAGHAVREAHEAHRAAVVRLQELQAERDDLARRLTALQEELAELGPPARRTDDEIDRVRAAVASWNQAAAFGELDPEAQALADAFADLHADLRELQERLGARPDPAALAAAEAEAARAAAALEEVEATLGTSALTDEDRAELDAIHEAVLEAEERVGRRIGAGAARRRLAELRQAERELLDRHGFATYLDVVLSGGKAGADDPRRVAAERTYLAATAALDSLRSALEPLPEEAYLESERARLHAHAVETLGIEPGDGVVELLRAHPRVPRPVVEDLRGALAAVGVHPVGVSLVDAAEAWLAAQAALAEAEAGAAAQVQGTEAELRALEARAVEVEAAIDEARTDEARAAAALDAASRSVGAFETELSVRAGEDQQRLKRLAAAEQLRMQVEALAKTLARAEEEAIATLDRATEEVAAAEAVVDRALGGVTEIASRARSLARELPIDQRPEGDPLTTLPALSVALRAHAEVLQPEIDAAATAVATATARVDEAVAAAEAAGTGDGPPRDEDVADGFAALLEARPETVIVLDEPFDGASPELRDRLLDVVADRSEQSPLVLLTEDPGVLGWAIELPAEAAAVVPTTALDGLRTTPAVVELHDEPTDPAHTASAPRWAGRR